MADIEAHSKEFSGAFVVADSGLEDFSAESLIFDETGVPTSLAPGTEYIPHTLAELQEFADGNVEVIEVSDEGQLGIVYEGLGYTVKSLLR